MTETKVSRKRKSKPDESDDDESYQVSKKRKTDITPSPLEFTPPFDTHTDMFQSSLLPFLENKDYAAFQNVSDTFSRLKLSDTEKDNRIVYAKIMKVFESKSLRSDKYEQILPLIMELEPGSELRRRAWTKFVNYWQGTGQSEDRDESDVFVGSEEFIQGATAQEWKDVLDRFVQITESVRDHLNVRDTNPEEIDETLSSFYESMYELIKTALLESYQEPKEVEDMILIALDDLVQHREITNKMKQDRWLESKRIQDKIKEMISRKKDLSQYVESQYEGQELASMQEKLQSDVYFLMTLLN